MAVPFSNTKLRVPKGFQNILEGLAREILRSQPENQFEFGSNYFEKLLKIREETGHDPAVHGAKLEDRFYNNESFTSPSIDPSSPQQQDAALTIQTNYRKHAAEQEVDKMREEEAAEKIQAGFRGFQDRQKFQEMKQEHSEDDANIESNTPETEAAAAKIQAEFKGFKARLEMKETKESEMQQHTNDGKEELDFMDPDVEEAAIRIQAGFKGMKARQEIRAMKEANHLEREDREEDREEEKETIDIDLNDPEVEKAALKIQAGFKGFQTRKELGTKREHEAEPKGENHIVENTAEIDKAATKIQAGFKGYKARQEMKAKREKDNVPLEVDEEVIDKAEDQNEGEVNINYNDPEVVNAVTIIQAGFKGYKTRQEVKQMKGDGQK